MAMWRRADQGTHLALSGVVASPAIGACDALDILTRPVEAVYGVNRGVNLPGVGDLIEYRGGGPAGCCTCLRGDTALSDGNVIAVDIEDIDLNPAAAVDGGANQGADIPVLRIIASPGIRACPGFDLLARPAQTIC